MKVKEKYPIKMDTFKTVEAFQEFLRNGGKIPDFVRIGHMPFMVEEYDDPGRYMYWANVRNMKSMEMVTADRYKSTKDAIIEISELCSYRTGFPYRF